MKVLVTSKSFGQYNASAITQLENQGFEIVRSDTPNPTTADICRQIKGVDVLVVGNDSVDASVINAADRLKLIHMHGTGLDAIDIEAAIKRNIYVANVPGANKNAVAELTIMLMLALGRQLHIHIDILRAGEWKRNAGHELSNSTVGIIGIGNIGQRIAELLKGFNPSIIAYDPFANLKWAAKQGVKLCPDSDEVFREADWIILSAPLTKETTHLINERTLSLMKPNTYLVNTARGGLVDENAICNAIKDKKIAGAALDTFSDEPLPVDSPLRATGMLLTPHIGATSIETASFVSQCVSQNIIDIIIHNNKKAAVNAEKIKSL